MKKEFYIGCSGYYYPYWKNRFYPKGLKPADWLTYYSSQFNTVELNGTFYRTPKLTDLQRFYGKTPDDFKFSVKVSRFITHLAKLKDCKTKVEEFKQLIEDGLQEKLLYLLFQLPPSFHYNEENLERIISSVPHSSNHIVELRHISWWNKEVEKAFKEANITFCNVDYPGLRDDFMHTTEVFYLRLHGVPELFKSSYTEEELKKFYKHFPKKAEAYSIYFNNTYYEAGYTNARELKHIITKK